MLSIYSIYARFPDTPLEQTACYSLLCLRRIDAIDTARIVLNLRHDQINDYVGPGSPIQIRWSSGGRSDEFYGYVHSFRPVSDGYSHQTVILAVSSAYPLFNESKRTFTQVGIHNIAQEIADDHRFQAEVDPHPLMQEQVLQGSDSDWSLLSRLANDWGYVLLIDGVTLIFRSMDRYMEEKYRLAQNDRTLEQVSNRMFGSNLLEFEPSLTAAKTSAAPSTGSGVNPISTQWIGWGEERFGIFQEASTGRAISSELEGELVAQAATTDRYFAHSAKAVMLAPMGKKPLDVYHIQHEGVRMSWMVTSIKHVVTGSDYLADMTLGSDGNDYSDRARGVGDGVDVAALIRNRKRSYRPQPVIINSRPYYIGTGANAAVSDQRWKARLIKVERAVA